jgi:hypothetical protein
VAKTTPAHISRVCDISKAGFTAINLTWPLAHLGRDSPEPANLAR